MLLRRGFVRWHACSAACTKPLQRWGIDEGRIISAALVHSLCMVCAFRCAHALASAHAESWQESLHRLHKRSCWARGRCMLVSTALFPGVAPYPLHLLALRCDHNKHCSPGQPCLMCLTF